MSDKKQQILNDLEQVNNLLISIKLNLIEENSNGKQFDYCTNSKLSDKINYVTKNVKIIDDIIYQND